MRTTKSISPVIVRPLLRQILEGMYLYKFNWADYQRYTPVPGNHSPDNPALRAYWERRNAAKTAIFAQRPEKVKVRVG